MTVSQFIQQLRQLVLEHPHAAQLDIVVAPHGHDHRQAVDDIHLNVHETKVVVEARR